VNKIVQGIVWIFSGPILIVTAVIFQIIIKFVFGNEGTVASLLSVATWLLGVIGVLLVIIGPIIGIIILAKKPDNTSK
jgi:hypothetical protein